MDLHFGRLMDKLQELGRLKDTAILVFGDHGEGLGEYLSPNGDRHVGHIHYLYECYMRVPLLLYRPGGEAGLVRNEPVTLLDIGPTITQMMGFKTPSFYQGRSLLASPRKNPAPIFQQTYKPEAAWDKFALWQYPWHLIFTPELTRLELFDLASDPAEKTDIYSGNAARSEIRSLRQKLERLTRDVLLNKEVIPLDKSDEELLKSLGYIRK
jgi:arylsulfatase A-like enzyme